MANLKDNNYHNLKIRVNKDEYWDYSKECQDVFPVPGDLRQDTRHKARSRHEEESFPHS